MLGETSTLLLGKLQAANSAGNAEGQRREKNSGGGRKGWGGEGSDGCLGSDILLLQWILFQPAGVQQLDAACDRRRRWITFPTRSCNIWHTGVRLLASCFAVACFSAGGIKGSPTLVAVKREEWAGKSGCHRVLAFELVCDSPPGSGSSLRFWGLRLQTSSGQATEKRVGMG